MFKNVNFLIRTLVLSGIVGLGGWWTIQFRQTALEREAEILERDEQIAELASTVAERDLQIVDLDTRVLEQQKEIDELEVAIWLLKFDHRVARIVVLEQTDDPANPDLVRTRVRFEELDRTGTPVGPGRELTVEGRVVYIEGLVIKFEDGYVEGSDLLRGSSVCMFRRMYGENQKPSDGVHIDSATTHPLAAGDEEGPDPYFVDLWEQFWEYANDPALAATKGVRASHGEAPFIEMRPGKTYRVELRASGGLTVVAE
jgi:hypothetical protein